MEFFDCYEHMSDDDFLPACREHAVEVQDNRIVAGWIYTAFLNAEYCPYCFTFLQLATPEAHDEISDTQVRLPKPVVGDGHCGSKSCVWSCRNCGYWQIYLLLESDHCYATLALMSKLRTFDTMLPGGVQDELLAALCKRVSIWNAMTPKRLETLVTEVFRENYAPCEAIHVGQPYDDGVDVVFVDSGARTWLIQVKRREKVRASEGVDTIRNALGVLAVHGRPQGIVVSSADHFTHRAHESAGRAHRNSGFTLKLVDRGKLMRIIGSPGVRASWQHAVKYHIPEMYDQEYPEVRAMIVDHPGQMYLFENGWPRNQP